MPLDPAYPAERLRFMLEDSAPVVLLTQGHLRAAIYRTARTALPVLDLKRRQLPGTASPRPISIPPASA